MRLDVKMQLVAALAGTPKGVVTGNVTKKQGVAVAGFCILKGGLLDVPGPIISRIWRGRYFPVRLTPI